MTPYRHAARVITQIENRDAHRMMVPGARTQRIAAGSESPPMNNRTPRPVSHPSNQEQQRRSLPEPVIETLAELWTTLTERSASPHAIAFVADVYF